MIIKVCGIKEAENQRALASLDIDMIGYNFYVPSSRYLDHQLPDLPTHIKKVGVFVNVNLNEIIDKMEKYQLDYIQLHGDENVHFVEQVQHLLPVIKVFRIDQQFNPKKINEFAFCDMLLFDTATPQYGGSGHKFDWKQLDNFNIQTPFLMSGGIGPKDIESIKEIDHPMFAGVDINSKFETSPGIKNVEMVGEFVHVVKENKI